MCYQFSVLVLAAFVQSIRAHGVIIDAQGDSGNSRGFLVDQTLARNCTTISPCQQDSTIIRDSEITQNIVNSCGRTEIAGNIDVGEQTENELAANRVTQVSRGTVMAVTIHQVNADGAGPYECDMDVTSNAATKFIPLKVANNVPGQNGLSQAKEQDFTINVQMPDDFNCIGASTGDICTVRCRNNAVAGPFGGCFAVQQTDGQGRQDQSAAAVDTAQTLEGISAQIQQNQEDLPAAIAANQAAGAAGGNEGASAISALITATQDPNAAATGAIVGGNGGGNGNGNNNQNGRVGNGNQNANGNAGPSGNQNTNGNDNANPNGQNGNANQNGQNGNSNQNTNRNGMQNAQSGNSNDGNGIQNVNGNTGDGNGNSNGEGNINGFFGGRERGGNDNKKRSKFLS